LDGLRLSWATERGFGCICPVYVIEDRRCIGHWSGHRLIMLSTYLFMRAGRLVTLFSWVPAFFGPTVMVDYWVGGLSTTLRSGLQCWGLGVTI
jgi:hypothetical protein